MTDMGQSWDAEGQLDHWYENVWADDIDYRPIEAAIDDTGSIHGRDAMRSYVSDWFDTIEDFRFEPEDVVDAGNNTFVIRLRLMGRMRGGDRQVVQRLHVLWRFRDGQLVYGREYRTREEALQAAGVSGE